MITNRTSLLAVGLATIMITNPASAITFNFANSVDSSGNIQVINYDKVTLKLVQEGSADEIIAEFTKSQFESYRNLIGGYTIQVAKEGYLPFDDNNYLKVEFTNFIGEVSYNVVKVGETGFVHYIKALALKRGDNEITETKGKLLVPFDNFEHAEYIRNSKKETVDLAYIQAKLIGSNLSPNLLPFNLNSGSDLKIKLSNDTTAFLIR